MIAITKQHCTSNKKRKRKDIAQATKREKEKIEHVPSRRAAASVLSTVSFVTNLCAFTDDLFVVFSF